MPIRPELSLAAQGVQIQSPIAKAGQLVSLQQAVQGGELQRLQLQELNRQIQDKDAIRGILRKHKGDIGAALSEVTQVDPATGISLGTSLRESEKSEIELQNSRIEKELKLMELASERSDQLARIGTDALNEPVPSKKSLKYNFVTAKIKAMGVQDLFPGIPGTFEENPQAAESFMESLVSQSLSSKEQFDRNIALMKAGRPFAEGGNLFQQDVAGSGEIFNLGPTQGPQERPLTDEVFQQQQDLRGSRFQTKTLIGEDGTPGLYQFDPTTGQIGEFLGEAPSAGGLGPAEKQERIQLIADAVQQGLQPPKFVGMSREGLVGGIRAELQKRGYPLARAEQDWDATRRHVFSMNSTQQLRLRQAIKASEDNIPKARELFERWKATGLPSGFRSFNRAALMAAMEFPGESGAVATALVSHLTDMAADMSVVYRGGGTPTDKALEEATKLIDSNFNEEQFNEAVDLMEFNLRTRRNSLMTQGPIGVSSGSPFIPQGQTSFEDERGAAQTGGEQYTEGDRVQTPEGQLLELRPDENGELKWLPPQ